MMISPDTYIMMHKKDSLEQLIAERKSLIKDINRLEKMVLSKDRTNPAWEERPSPAVRYQMHLEYLAELCMFLSENYSKMIE